MSGELHGSMCSGQANGTAYVQFEDAATAKDAFERYNNVALDGKPMKIAFDQGSARTLSSGIRCACSISILFMYCPICVNKHVTGCCAIFISLWLLGRSCTCKQSQHVLQVLQFCRIGGRTTGRTGSGRVGLPRTFAVAAADARIG